ncbi:MAG: multidrug effflux MFS transporter [Steroidobacteraceae bacterium]|nr:multidrug effflux MFS transporter [Steroidobacteraceae bacterium]
MGSGPASLRGRSLAKLVLFTGLTGLSIDLYLPAFPAIAADLGATPGEVQRTLSAYLFGVAIGQLFAGPLSDQIGRRPVLMGGLILHVIASLGCVFANSPDQLILLRLLQALGGCVMPVVARGHIRDQASGHYAARALSTVMAATLIVPLVAPALGGIIVEQAGWRATFAVLALAASISLFVAWRSFPETNARAGGPVRWRELVLMQGFGQVLRDPVSQRYIGTTMLTSGGLFAYLAASPFVFISWFGVPADKFFLVFGANVLAIAAGAQLNARIVSRYGSRKLFEHGLMLQVGAASCLVAAAWLEPHNMYLYALPLLVFLSGVHLVGTNASACTLDRFPHASGTASALAGTSQFLLGALITAGVGNIPLPAPQGMALVIITCMAAGTTVAWTLRGRAAAAAAHGEP